MTEASVTESATGAVTSQFALPAATAARTSPWEAKSQPRGSLGPRPAPSVLPRERETR